MILDLNRPRDRYFEQTDATAIARKHIDADPITVTRDIRKLALEGRTDVATNEQDLEGLLAHKYTKDTAQAVKTVNENTGNLIILPPEYRISTEEARDVVVYGLDTLILLDSMGVKRRLMDDPPKRLLSKKRKRELQWGPEKVINAAFTKHTEEGDINAQHSSYSWW